MVLHKCFYCKKSIMNEDWIGNSFRIFKITIKHFDIMHRKCFIEYENKEDALCYLLDLNLYPKLYLQCIITLLSSIVILVPAVNLSCFLSIFILFSLIVGILFALN